MTPEEIEFRGVWLGHIMDEWKRAQELAVGMRRFAFELDKRVVSTEVTYFDYSKFLKAILDLTESQLIQNDIQSEMLDFIKELSIKEDDDA